MSLSTTVSTLNDHLIPNLSYALPRSAQYVTARTGQILYPQSAGAYTPQGGQNLVRISLSTQTGGAGFLDPMSVRLRFKFTNLTQNTAEGVPDPSSQIALAGPRGCIFQRCRLLAGGRVVQDSPAHHSIEYYLMYNSIRDRSKEMYHDIRVPWYSNLSPAWNNFVLTFAGPPPPGGHPRDGQP